MAAFQDHRFRILYCLYGGRSWETIQYPQLSKLLALSKDGQSSLSSLFRGYEDANLPSPNAIKGRRGITLVEDDLAFSVTPEARRRGQQRQLIGRHLAEEAYLAQQFFQENPYPLPTPKTVYSHRLVPTLQLGLPRRRMGVRCSHLVVYLCRG